MNIFLDALRGLAIIGSIKVIFTVLMFLFAPDNHNSFIILVAILFGTFPWVEIGGMAGVAYAGHKARKTTE